MKYIILFLFLTGIAPCFSMNYSGEEVPKNIEALVFKLRKQMFNGDFFLAKDIVSSSSVAEVESFLNTLEKTGDPEAVRPYLNYLVKSEGTSIRFLELLRQRVAQDPKLMAKISESLREIKGEMKKANLRFPTPIRCAAGIATYIGMQDWYLSFKSSFFSEEELERIYKEEIVDPTYKFVIGFVATTCLGDAILSVKNGKEYFKELKVDKAVESNRAFFQELVDDLAHARVSLEYSKANIDSLMFIDQHLDELVDKLSAELGVKKEQQKARIRKGLKGLYYSYISHRKHRKIEDIWKSLRKEHVLEDAKGVAFYEAMANDFSQYMGTYEKTDRGSILREIEQDYEEKMEKLVQSRQPSNMTKACFAGVGVSTTLFGLHAAAGREETSIDDYATKLIRDYYYEYQHIFIPALIAPCIWQLNHFPAILMKKFSRGHEKKFKLTAKGQRIAKKALLNTKPSDEELSRFTNPSDIIRYNLNPHLAGPTRLPIPSLKCLKTLHQLARSPASLYGSCSRLMNKLISFQDTDYLSVKYNTIAQLRAYNKLSDQVMSSGKKSFHEAYMEIEARAKRYCD